MIPSVNYLIQKNLLTDKIDPKHINVVLFISLRHARKLKEIKISGGTRGYSKWPTLKHGRGQGGTNYFDCQNPKKKFLVVIGKKYLNRLLSRLS